jgi:hypothetical protein
MDAKVVVVVAAAAAAQNRKGSGKNRSWLWSVHLIGTGWADLLGCL